MERNFVASLLKKYTFSWAYFENMHIVINKSL